MRVNAVEHFRAQEKAQDVKDRDRQKWFVASRRNQQRMKEERLDQAEDLLDLATSVLLADPIEAEKFQAKLDTYDEATVKALMENQRQLDVVNERIVDMLSRAHKLDDGRRVFKTIDGTQVFDEHGSELGAETIHPNQIRDDAPRWEHYQADVKRGQKLDAERQEILDYQEKLDEARERSNSEDFTQDELEEFDAELADSMPTAVAEQMPGYEPAPQASLSKDFSATAVAPALPTPNLQADGLTPGL